MIKYCKDKWNENKEKLKEALRNDTHLNSCEYLYLVKMVVTHILNKGDHTRWYDDWNVDKITMIDNGDYQGTLLFLIPLSTYQPAEHEYLMTYVSYGSCSGCDTLMSIQEWSDKPPTKRQLSDFMALCLHIVQNMVKPYNCGWRNDELFEQIEE